MARDEVISLDGATTEVRDPEKPDPDKWTWYNHLIFWTIALGAIVGLVFLFAQIEGRPSSEEVCIGHGGLVSIEKGEGTVAVCADDTTHWIRPDGS